jgi:hypothetical protein
VLTSFLCDGVVEFSNLCLVLGGSDMVLKNGIVRNGQSRF